MKTIATEPGTVATSDQPSTTSQPETIILFHADSTNIWRTLKRTTGWMNHYRGSHSSKPFTNRTRAARLANDTAAAFAIWESAILFMTDRWSPSGYHFDIIGEPGEMGIAPYGWVRDATD